MARLHDHLQRHPEHQYEIVIGNNGSTDHTAEVAEALAKKYAGLRVCHFAVKGRGGVLREIWGRGGADIFIYMDVDLSTDLEAMPKMIASLAAEKFDLVTGTRLHRDSMTKRSLRRELISRSYNYLVRLTFSTQLTDLQCGFKGFSKEAVAYLLPLVEDRGFFFDTEILLLAEKRGYRILDLPVTWVENTDSRVKILRTAWVDVMGLIRLRRSFRADSHK